MALDDVKLPFRISSEVPQRIDGLCRCLGLDEKFIEDVLNTPDDERYSTKEIKKVHGTRIVHNPRPKVRYIQKAINERIFKSLIRYPDFLFGSLPNEKINGEVICRDYISCAKVHCGAKSILKMDISNFFDNIHIEVVAGIFSGFLKFDPTISNVLANLCCKDGSLPQGGLTSSYLAMLSFWDVEYDVVRKLKRKGLRYTRLVDDITISSTIRSYSYDLAERYVSDMLSAKELPDNKEKRIVIRSGMNPLEVHGLRVNFNEPRLPAKEVKKIRAAVNQIIQLSKVNNYRTSFVYRREYDRCMGRVNKLARVGHNQHLKLLAKLDGVEPLPSKIDIQKVQKQLKDLEQGTNRKENKNNRKMIRKFYLCQYRNTIINRLYPKEATCFRTRLKALREFYELDC